QWVIEDLLSTGLTLLVGAPKIGKSWLTLYIALCVSSGTPLWGFATTQGEVLCLCLEDTFSRIQQRLWRLTDEASECLYFAVQADRIQGGLLSQLQSFIAEHPKTKLVFVDTFQTVRMPSRDSAYAADYNDIGVLKRFADDNGIALLVVHHTRKMGDSDVFNTVSGTTGITGSADSTLVLTRDTRCGGTATLSVTGRDVEFQELKLRFHDCRWELVEKTSPEELEERDVPDAVLRVVDFMATRPGDWEGTATNLAQEVHVENISVAVLGKYLAQHHSFMASRGVSYARRHHREGNLLTLSHVPSCELSEGTEG
ncbi:MAG: AAA family ATPase, partial [Raoultibacter sp.]